MTSGQQVRLGINNSTVQHINLIFQFVKFITSHDELVIRQFKFRCPLARNPVPLPATLTAKLFFTTGTLGVGKYMSAPATSALSSLIYQYRHDEIVRRSNLIFVSLPVAPENLFASDNFSGVHPRYLEAIARANHGHQMAYGADSFTGQAVDLFSQLCDMDVEVLFCFGGTGANVVALGSLLGTAESVVCSEWAHIQVDETGAPEKFLGIKLQDLVSPNAKITPDQLREVAGALGNVHHVQPGVVSITQSTELGTLYSVAEISALCDTAHSYGMRVHLDGARIANAVAALGGDADTFREMTFGAGVDAVSFGGTKNAMLGAEAVLLRRDTSNPRAAFIRKQTTQLPSKMRYASAQFVEALSDGLWIETATTANSRAVQLYSLVADLNIGLTGAPEVNSLYPFLAPPIKKLLQEWSFFWDWDLPSSQVRWMASWDTSQEDVERFATGVKAAIETFS